MSRARTTATKQFDIAVKHATKVTLKGILHRRENLN